MKLGSIITGLLLIAAIAAWIICFPAKFLGPEGLWLFSGGLWVIPALLQLGAFWFLYVAYRAHKSRSHPIDGMGRILFDQDAGIIPIYKIGQYYFFAGLQIGAIGVLVWQYLER